MPNLQLAITLLKILHGRSILWQHSSQGLGYVGPGGALGPEIGASTRRAGGKAATTASLNIGIVGVGV